MAILAGVTPSESGKVMHSALDSENMTNLDLGVAAVKSTLSTWPLQVKSSRFNSKSPPKFFT